ncbi:hypothetical protein J6590_024651 [Homalodisca vitripennis]|nr:hypothetical protein J6590_024651 [Homalodisca vitripennis]
MRHIRRERKKRNIGGGRFLLIVWTLRNIKYAIHYGKILFPELELETEDIFTDRVFTPYRLQSVHSLNQSITLAILVITAHKLVYTSTTSPRNAPRGDSFFLIV